MEKNEKNAYGQCVERNIIEEKQADVELGLTQA